MPAFFQAQRIIVGPLTSSFSTTPSLLVQPFYSTGSGCDVLIKFGNFNRVSEEYNNFKEYVAPFVGGGRNTSALDFARTPLLGGIMYSLLSASNDRWEDFGSFYVHTDVQHIEETLKDLFLKTCGAWYANPGSLEMHDLARDYLQLFDFTFEDLNSLIGNHIPSIRGKHFLYFKSLSKIKRLFTNPMIVCAEKLFSCPTYVCITHGNFNQHNILVDNNRQAWLVNFQYTCQGHILRDISRLDTVIRIQLLRAEEATLDERLVLEEALCRIERFSQVTQLTGMFSTDNQALLKAYTIVASLRCLAYQLVSKNPMDDLREYYVALLYNALHTLSMPNLPIVQREHALLSASILAERLGLEIRHSFTDDVLEAHIAISNRSYESHQKLTAIILKRLGTLSSTLISSIHFDIGTLWEIVLPEMHLKLANRKAILLLRQEEIQNDSYKELQQIATDHALIIIIDIADVAHSPFQDSPRTIWFSYNVLLEIIELSQDQLPGWFERFLITRTEKNVKLTLIPYHTKGAAKLFVGREYELKRMTQLDKLGGMITGAHHSGKSSLLHQLGIQLQEKNFTVIGPLQLGSIGFQTLFERTLKKLNITASPDMTPEHWASALRDQSERLTKPVFLLDEVDELLKLDTQNGFILGRQMRSLHHEGYCYFYLAGLQKLRNAVYYEYGPFRNFTNEAIITGVTEEESRQLIQRPMNDIGFDISDEQATRIFKGTAGVPYLIQDFCIHLLCSLPHEQANNPKIEDSAIDKIEMSHTYHTTVRRYYDYAQEWDSRCIMLCAVLHKEINRQEIMQEFIKNDAPLERSRLDTLLDFLVDFGILQPLPATNLYSILPGYLSQAYMARDPVNLLHSLFKERDRKGEM